MNFFKKSPFLWAFLISVFFFKIDSFEIKGVWVTRWDIYSPQRIEEIVESLSIANVTDVYVQVYGSGYAFFKSKIAPLRYRDFDPLETFIEKAHSRNIRIHAWINLLYMWDRKDLTEENSHILNRYPSSVVVDDKNVSLLDYSFEKVKSRNIEGFFVSPASEIVKDYLLFLIDEILVNYNVDGIHLDYARFPGKEFIYDVFIRSDFIEKFFVDPFSLDSDRTKELFGLKGNGILKSEWAIFPKEELNILIKEIFTLVKTHNPNIKLSSSVFADINVAEDNFHQKWIDWINGSYIDYVLIMAYASSFKVIEKQIEKIQSRTSLSKVVVGLALYNQSIENLTNNYNHLKKYPVLGFCIFSNQSLTEKKGGYSYVGKKIFN